MYYGSQKLPLGSQKGVLVSLTDSQTTHILSIFHRESKIHAFGLLQTTNTLFLAFIGVTVGKVCFSIHEGEFFCFERCLRHVHCRPDSILILFISFMCKEEFSNTFS